MASYEHETVPGTRTQLLLDSIARELQVSRMAGHESQTRAYRRRILPMYIVLAAADIRFVEDDTSFWFERHSLSHLKVMHDDWVQQHARASEMLGPDKTAAFTGMTLQPAAHNIITQNPPAGFELVRQVVQEEFNHDQRMSHLVALALEESESQAVKL